MIRKKMLTKGRHTFHELHNFSPLRMCKCEGKISPISRENLLVRNIFLPKHTAHFEGGLNWWNEKRGRSINIRVDHWKCCTHTHASPLFLLNEIVSVVFWLRVFTMVPKQQLPKKLFYCAVFFSVPTKTFFFRFFIPNRITQSNGCCFEARRESIKRNCSAAKKLV